jgi:hypothetical protein
MPIMKVKKTAERKVAVQKSAQIDDRLAIA